MRLMLAQINTTIADFQGNLDKIARACERARADGAQLVVTPELAVTGYPPLDLLERPEILRRGVEALSALAAASRGLTLIAGVALPNPRHGRVAINAAVVLQDGAHIATVQKRLLPTYDVFDEDRYFAPGDAAVVLELGGRRVGVTICEDIWSHAEAGPARYGVDPVAELVAAGADFILNLSASPFELGKPARRLALVRAIAALHRVPVAYCNLVGGNDALVFDGRSFAVDATGALIALAPAFCAADLAVDLAAPAAPALFPTTASDALEVRQALVLGLRDYAAKCGFSDAVLGLSGGIDSAVTAAVAVEALGADHVTGLALPGPYSSDGSITDALALAANLGMRCATLAIAEPYAALQRALEPELARFATTPHDITGQNLQARVRGTMLMAFSNRSGALLLTTGNKSELAVGYCTLYGDMNGGLAVIGDVPKMLVYDVARTYNTARTVIPQSTLDKPPSAELAPDQKDEDSLPPYPVLDAILELYVVQGASVADMVAAGHPAAVVKRVVHMVDQSEYKRRQAAPVLRVTQKAFGAGRRLPMARRMPE